MGVQIECAALHRSLGNVLFVVSSGRYYEEGGSPTTTTTNTPTHQQQQEQQRHHHHHRSVRRHTAEDTAIDDHRHDDDEDEEDDDDEENEFGDSPHQRRRHRQRQRQVAFASIDNESNSAVTTPSRRIVRHHDQLWRVLRCELNESDVAVDGAAAATTTTTTTTTTTIVRTQTLFKVRRGLTLQLSADSRHIICVAGTIVKLFDTHQQMLRSFQSKLRVTCCAVSPSLVDGIVALGDVSGRIALWR